MVSSRGVQYRVLCRQVPGARCQVDYFKYSAYEVYGAFSLIVVIRTHEDFLWSPAPKLEVQAGLPQALPTEHITRHLLRSSSALEDLMLLEQSEFPGH